jgi:hypothetical protein
MKFISNFNGYLNESKSLSLVDLAMGVSYEDFLTKVYMNYTQNRVLFRGSGRELEDNIFMTDDLDHAEQYGEDVDGIVYMEDIIEFNNDMFDELRDTFDELLIPNIPRDYNYEDYEPLFIDKLKKIYSPYFKEGKLGDAMYQLNKDEDGVIDYVYDFITNSTEDYRKISMTKKNDFFIPILTYYGKIEGYNIISFWGSDYGGGMEYVVNDISKYQRLSDIWRKSNKSI